MENDDLRIFFIEVYVSSQESGPSCIRLLGISTLNLSTISLLKLILFRQCVIILFIILFF